MQCKCKQCGKSFELTDGEINFYKSKGLSLPKRCKECRNKNKKPQVENVFEDSSYVSKQDKKTVPGALKIALILIVCCIGIGIYVYNSLNHTDVYGTEDSDQYITDVYGVEDSASNTTDGYSVEESASNTADEYSTGDSGQNESAVYSTDATVCFRNSDLREEHYQKHGISMGFASAEEYENAAAAVVNNGDSLQKLEAEDGDDVYYLEETNEFVIVSTDGYLRTYFCPDDGKAYFDRQ